MGEWVRFVAAASIVRKEVSHNVPGSWNVQGVKATIVADCFVCKMSGDA
jgi:hypothetical protein